MSRVNQRELSEIFGVSDVTVQAWQEKEGMPVANRGERGRPNEYDTAEVIAWHVARKVAAVSSETHKDRLARLQGDALELELAEKRGELVPAGQVRPVWEARVLAAAAFLSARSSRLAAMLEVEAGVEAKRALLRKEDAEFLTRLGVEGERIQAQLDELLARLAHDEAESFLRRIAGNEPPSPPAGPTEGGLV